MPIEQFIILIHYFFELHINGYHDNSFVIFLFITTIMHSIKQRIQSTCRLFINSEFSCTRLAVSYIIISALSSSLHQIVFLHHRFSPSIISSLLLFEVTSFKPRDLAVFWKMEFVNSSTPRYDCLLFGKKCFVNVFSI